MSKELIGRLGILFMVIAALGACADDAGGDEAHHTLDASAPDADSAGDAADALDDAGDDPKDAGHDAAAPACEAFPSALIAGTPQTDELAEDPSHCGQSSYAWLDDPTLGDVTEYGVSKDISAALIEGLLASEGVTPPREVAYNARVQQFAYTTQDRGELIDASAMVAYPSNAEPSDGPLEVILLLHGTTGFNDACAPSGDLASQGLAALLASFGYFVVAPDYIGLKGVGDATGFLHPYLVGQATAIASLDAVRAAAKLPADKRGGWCVEPEVVAFGGSQGGHAALWVDRLAPYYAREIELLGTVATVPPADMVGQMDRALEQLVDATGNTVAFLGASAGWYGHAERLDEVFVSPLDEQVPAALGAECNPGDSVGEPTSTADIFQPALVEAASNDTLADVVPWGCMTAENGLTTTSVARIAPESESYGILYVLGENDDLVHTPIERDAFETLCAQGMQMQFLECAGASHTEATFFAMPELLDFVDARFAREPFTGEGVCQVDAPVECRGTL